jgi:uncharacterized protein YndB with AHSA1/START domain
MQEIDVNVRERVLKPISEVFEAIVDPAHMSRYFISGASGPLEAGRTVIWEFADVGAEVPVSVVEVVPDRTIVLEGGSPKTRTTIRLAPEDFAATLVTITESPFSMDEGGVKRALGQTAGWTHFLCSLKAYVQYGVNVRAGLKERVAAV